MWLTFIPFLLLDQFAQWAIAAGSVDSFATFNTKSVGICPCLNGGKCTEVDGELRRCLCPPGFRGPRCEQCVVANSRCKGFCHPQRPGECTCPEGKGGQFCDKDLVFCTRHQPCQNGGTCLNSPDGNYTCKCQAGFKGANCEQRLTHCGDEPCQNEGKCVQDPNGFHCECPENIFGRFCQVRATGGCYGENPCQNGGSCANYGQLSFLGPLASHRMAEEGNEEFKCICADGWTGTVCDLPMAFCPPNANPCQNDAICLLDPSSILPSSPGFVAFAPSAGRALFCAQNVDDCRLGPCFNGGICEDGHNSFRCHCKTGFKGELCEEQEGQQQQQITRTKSMTKTAIAEGECHSGADGGCSSSFHPSFSIATSILLLLLALIALLMAILALICLLRQQRQNDQNDGGGRRGGRRLHERHPPPPPCQPPPIAIVCHSANGKVGKQKRQQREEAMLAEQRYVMEPMEMLSPIGTRWPMEMANAYLEQGCRRHRLMRNEQQQGMEGNAVSESGHYEEIMGANANDDEDGK